MSPSTPSAERVAGFTGSTASQRPVITAEFLAGILREITQPFLLLARGGRLVLWNRALEEMCGYGSAQMMELGLPDLVGRQQAEEEIRIAGEVLRTGQPGTHVTEWRSRAGEPMPQPGASLLQRRFLP